MKLAKVDAVTSANLAAQHGVRGYPTILLMRQGSIFSYTGGRTEDEIVDWVLRRTGFGVKRILTDYDQQQLESSNKISVLGVFSSVDSDNAKKYLALVAESDEKFFYAVTYIPRIKENLGLPKEKDAIIVYKPFDERRADLVLDSAVDEKVIERFIEIESIPLIQEYTQEGSRKIFSSPITKHAFICTKPGKM